MDLTKILELSKMAEAAGLPLGKFLELAVDSNSITKSQEEEFPQTQDNMEIAKFVAKRYWSHQRNKDGIIYKYDASRGVWTPTKKDKFIAAIENDIEECWSGSRLTNGVITDVSSIVLRKIIAQDDNMFVKSEKDVVVASNCELHLDTMTGQWEQKPHAAENYRICGIAAEFDEAAECPTFKAMMSRAFGGIEDSENTIKRVLELMGMSLVADNSEAQIIFLSGDGRNGKGALLRALQGVIGHENVSGIAPNKLSDERERVKVYGKLLAICGDVSKNVVVSDGELKDMSAGDPTTGRFLYGEAFTFEPTSTFWFAGNNGLKSHDTSIGIVERLNIVPFLNVIPEDERDEGIYQKLEDESSGILNVILKAYGDKRQRGYFTKSSLMDKSKLSWTSSNNMIQRFVEEMMNVKAKSKVSHKSVWESFREWCLEAGIKNHPNRHTLQEEMLKLLRQKGVSIDNNHAGAWTWRGAELSGSFTVIEPLEPMLKNRDNSSVELF